MRTNITGCIDVLRIAIDRIRRPRYMVGVTILLLASLMLSAAPRSGFADQPFSWFFIAVSLLLLTYRNYIEVNPAKGRLAHRTGFVFGFIRKRFDIGTIEHVEIKSFTRRSGKHSKREMVAIDVEGKSGGRLCELEEMFAARLVAEQVSRALAVPLENRLFGGWSVRNPEDLDLPLAERWRRANRLKVAPVIDAASTLIVSHADNASEISMPVPKFPRVITAAVGVSLVLGILLLTRFTEMPVWVPLFAVPVITYVTIGLITRHSGRDRLRFDRVAVEYRRGVMLGLQRMDIAAIEEILEHGGKIALMSDRNLIHIDRPEAERDRELLRQFVERQLSQRQLPLAAD